MTCHHLCDEHLLQHITQYQHAIPDEFVVCEKNRCDECREPGWGAEMDCDCRVLDIPTKERPMPESSAEPELREAARSRMPLLHLLFLRGLRIDSLERVVGRHHGSKPCDICGEV